MTQKLGFRSLAFVDAVIRKKELIGEVFANWVLLQSSGASVLSVNEFGMSDGSRLAI